MDKVAYKHRKGKKNMLFLIFSNFISFIRPIISNIISQRTSSTFGTGNVYPVPISNIIPVNQKFRAMSQFLYLMIQ